MLVITAGHVIFFLLAVLLISIIIDFFTVPVQKDIPGDKFNPYCEDHEQNFDADYEVKDKWRRDYEYPN